MLASYGTPEFEAEYHAAVAGKPVSGVPRGPAKQTLQWLWDLHRKSSYWTTTLKNATRRQRENIMVHALKNAGEMPLTALTKAVMIQGREDRAATPSQANNFLNTMRTLCRWAVEHGHLTEDPTLGVKDIARPKSGGFPVWTEEEIAKFKARWPLGTRERLAFEIYLTTGLRRGDVARFGPAHCKDGWLRIETEKNGEIVEQEIDPDLTAAIDSMPAPKHRFPTTTFISNLQNGKPMRKEAIGTWFAEACKEAKVYGKSAHGIRKASAEALAEQGATVKEMDSVFGWRGGRMAMHYTDKADRKKLAQAAAAKRRSAREAGVGSAENSPTTSNGVETPTP